MSSKFAPESLLALRQVVDEKLTTEDVEHILEQISENIPKELMPYLVGQLAIIKIKLLSGRSRITTILAFHLTASII